MRGLADIPAAILVTSHHNGEVRDVQDHVIRHPEIVHRYDGKRATQSAPSPVPHACRPLRRACHEQRLRFARPDIAREDESERCGVNQRGRVRLWNLGLHPVRCP